MTEHDPHSSLFKGWIATVSLTAFIALVGAIVWTVTQ